MWIFMILAGGTVVLQRNEKLIVRHRRSTESENQQALKHQFLDCGHLFLISDCGESVLKLVRLRDERPQDVVELLHIIGCVSLRDVTDQCCLHMLNLRQTCSTNRISLTISCHAWNRFCPRVCCIVISGPFAVVLCKNSK